MSINLGAHHTERFTNSHTIGPHIGFSLQPQLYTNMSLSLSETVFFGDSARDAGNLSTGFDQYLFFMENRAYGFLSYRYSDESTKGSEFDNIGNLITVGVSFTDSSDEFNIQLSYLYNLVEYKNETASIGAKRKDEKQTFALSITQPILEPLSIVLDYQHNITDSNLISVDAKQNLLTFKIALSY